MKIQGKSYEATAKPFTVTMVDGSEVVLVLSPLPPGFAEGEEEEIPQPKLPYRIPRQPKTGRILRDENGNPITVPDEQDAAYQRKILRCGMGRAARTVYATLREEPSIEWETTSEAYPKAEEFYHELSNEMTASGLGAAQQTEIIRVAMEMTGLNIKDAQEVAEARFPDGEEPRPQAGEESVGGQGQDDGIHDLAELRKVEDSPVGMDEDRNRKEA